MVVRRVKKELGKVLDECASARLAVVNTFQSLIEQTKHGEGQDGTVSVYDQVPVQFLISNLALFKFFVCFFHYDFDVGFYGIL